MFFDALKIIYLIWIHPGQYRTEILPIAESKHKSWLILRGIIGSLVTSLVICFVASIILLPKVNFLEVLWSAYLGIVAWSIILSIAGNASSGIALGFVIGLFTGITRSLNFGELYSYFAPVLWGLILGFGVGIADYLPSGQIKKPEKELMIVVFVGITFLATIILLFQGLFSQSHISLKLITESVMKSATGSFFGIIGFYLSKIWVQIRQ